ncbi:MAG: cellulase family glycosylhydrolase [Deltaproteobacteria bacterium]|nr:cellulase family glycosylhydrolase [Deltaproteobacteria bacterium]
MNAPASRFIFLVILATMVTSLFSFASCGDDDDDDTSSTSVDDDSDDDTGDDDTNADDDTVDDDTGDDDTGDEKALPWLRAVNGDAPAIVDELGRQVILRGANFNHLGDYFETHPTLPTVAPLTEDDWEDAAAQGMNVVRLVTTWSAWEPERDQYSEEYLQRVRDAVAQAAAHDMYVVIDMHQDAWSKFVFTPAEETCPEGTSHQRGWDGAPEWATYTDGEPTCTPGRREDSPAVKKAWENFYDNREGIQDELIELWGRIAAEFADEPTVAGYDLLNEPGNGPKFFGTMQQLADFYRGAIDAIRAAESAAGSQGHIVFFETSVTAAPPTFDFQEDNTVFAPHNYFESIISGPEGLLDIGFFLFDLLGSFYKTPVWVGEYNYFGDAETGDAWMTRYAALDDQFLQSGGTWWQWEQECGDPHNSQWPPSQEWLEQQQEKCGNARFQTRACSDRGYPRAAPGRLTFLSAVPCDGELIVEGTTGKAGTADLWMPAYSDEDPQVRGEGLGETVITSVKGGWRITVEVNGEYKIRVIPSPDELP